MPSGSADQVGLNLGEPLDGSHGRPGVEHRGGRRHVVRSASGTPQAGQSGSGQPSATALGVPDSVGERADRWNRTLIARLSTVDTRHGPYVDLGGHVERHRRQEYGRP
jgi:hypothetical protein